MAKTTYNPGDFVVYPTHGVGKVSDISKDNVAGCELELIVVNFDKDRMTLRIPMAKAESAGLRKISNRNSFGAALTTLKGKPKAKRSMWSRRAQEYEAKINSGNPVAIAEVVRDLHRDEDQAEQSYSERIIYEQAFDRLVSEYAAVEKINASDAADRLVKIIHTNT